VDERPSAPSYISINYSMESTNQNIPAGMKYSTDSTFTVSSSGTGKKITVTPGQDLFFITMATNSSFASVVYRLRVPERPATPTATIDYEAVTTVESFPSAVVFSNNPNYTGPITCTGTPISLIPGQDLYIWVKQTVNSFASNDYHLVVPEKPILEYTGADAIDFYPFIVRAVLDESTTGFNLTDVSVINGHPSNLRGDNTFDIFPAQKGDVRVIIPVNSINGANFISNEVIVYYDPNLSAIPHTSYDNFNIYPNPSHDGKIYITTTLRLPYTIDVISGEGSLIKSIIADENNNQQVDLQGLPKGNYYLKIHTDDTMTVHKIILE
jgi:hypothetical protein